MTKRKIFRKGSAPYLKDKDKHDANNTKSQAQKQNTIH